jgi:hypothetical protein
MLDVTIQQGIGAVRTFVQQVLATHPDVTESELLFQVQELSVARATRLGESISRLIRLRRERFRTTPYFSDSPLGLQ